MSSPTPSHPELLTAREAADRLGVKPATLYAYVSRGLLASEPATPEGRERRYRRAEVEALAARRGRGGPVPPPSLSGAEPVLDSSITAIEDARLYYRGHDAVRLARTCTFEAVAELLWLGELPEDPELGEEPEQGAVAPETIDPPSRYHALDLRSFEPFERLPVLLPLAGLEDLARHDPRPEAVARCGRRLLGQMARAAAGVAGTGRVAEVLARGWQAGDDPRAVRLFDAALILAADHELNVSSFTARCVSSAGTTPYEVVSAGLAALRGKRHGGLARSAEILVAELAREARSDRTALARALVRRLEGGAAPPGFGHPLYPTGDPRGRALLELMAECGIRPRRAAFFREIAGAAREVGGGRPTIDFGLACLVHLLDLPRGASLALFALGRSAGWIAHALEQAATDTLIRPRARYVGPCPEDGDEAQLE